MNPDEVTEREEAAEQNQIYFAEPVKLTVRVPVSLAAFASVSACTSEAVSTAEAEAPKYAV